MSTISQALIKNKFEQTGGTPPVMQVENKTSRWKFAFSVAVLIIVALLTVLIYMQFYPHYKSATKLEQVQTVTIIEPEALTEEVITTVIDEPLIKMTFDTQPIPQSSVTKDIKIGKSTATVKQVTEAPKTSSPPQQPKPVLSTKSTPQNNSLAISIEEADRQDMAEEISNSNEIQSDLQKRFELAVLLTEMEQDEGTLTEKSSADLADSLKNSFDDGLEEQRNDGSDIHLMSSNFQNKIPLIRYDAHVYSSIVSERWVRLNGERLVEGSFDSTGKLQLIEIQPQRSIFRVGRQSFSLESLTDWKGY